MSKKINNPGLKIYVKRFAVAKATFMKYHIQPSLRNAPKHLIFYVGTSDLDPDKTGGGKYREYLKRLCNAFEKIRDDVSISSIILRTDKAILDKRVCLVNSIFSE